MASLNLADGRTINFPDGLTPDQVQSIATAAMQGGAQGQPEAQGRAQGQDITPNNVVRSMATGVPIVGGVLNNANAAINATLAPLLNPMFSKDQQLSQPNWSDRYDASLAQQNGMDQGYAQAHPVASTVGNLAGGVAAGVAAGGLLPSGSMATSLSGKVLQGGLLGGGIGGADGFTRTQGDVSRRLAGAETGAAFGAITGGAVPIITRGVGGVAQSLLGKRPQALTNEQLYATKQAGYDAAKNSGLQFSPDAWSRTVNDITNTAQDQFGIGGKLGPVTNSLFPKSTGLLDAMQGLKGNSPNLTDVEMLKRLAGNVASSPDESAVGSMMASKLRNSINNATPEDFVSGNVDAGINGIQQGRKAALTLMKAKQIEEAMRVADVKGSANYSQAGTEQALKRQFTNIATKPDFKTSWTPEEQQAILDVISGGGKQASALRWLGKMAPTGGLSSSMNLLLTSIAPHIGIPVAVVSTAAKALSSGSTAARAGLLDQIVRNGGTAPVAKRILGPAAQKLIASGLLGAGGQASGGVYDALLSRAR